MIIGKTKSVCPVCLRVVDAQKRSEKDGIYLDKRCDEHGAFSALIWEGNLASYLRWNSENTAVDRDLANLRGEIDDIDAELLQLLARRMEVSAQIGEYKKRNNVTVVQMDRWKKILADHIATGNDLGLSPQLINEVFEAIHQASIERQSRIMESNSNQL